MAEDGAPEDETDEDIRDAFNDVSDDDERQRGA
jgi:hypothetical protein